MPRQNGPPEASGAHHSTARRPFFRARPPRRVGNPSRHKLDYDRSAKPRQRVANRLGLIKRADEVDALTCSRGEMKIVAFIEPPQGALIESTPHRCGLWDPSTPRALPSEEGWVYEPEADWEGRPISVEEPGELTYIDLDEFPATLSATFRLAETGSLPVPGTVSLRCAANIHYRRT